MRPAKGEPEDLWAKSVSGQRSRLNGSALSTRSLRMPRFSSPTVSELVCLDWYSYSLDRKLCLCRAVMTERERTRVWSWRSRRAECCFLIASFTSLTHTSLNLSLQVKTKLIPESKIINNLTLPYRRPWCLKDSLSQANPSSSWSFQMRLPRGPYRR